MNKYFLGGLFLLALLAGNKYVNFQEEQSSKVEVASETQKTIEEVPEKVVAVSEKSAIFKVAGVYEEFVVFTPPGEESSHMLCLANESTFQCYQKRIIR